MKKLIFLIAVFFMHSLYAQDYKTLWSEAIQNELDGKTETANKKVQSIYEVAKQNNNEEQIIKCFFYTSKFRQVFEEKAQENIISNLKTEITNASPTSKAVLNYLYGSILTDYLNYNSYTISKRTSVENNTSTDFLTWSIEDFKKEIDLAFAEALKEQNLLQKTPIANYTEILEIPSYVNSKDYSLFDLLHKEIVKQYSLLLKSYNIDDKHNLIEKDIESFYANSEQFSQIKTDQFKPLLKTFITILQQKEKVANNKDATLYERLNNIHQIFLNEIFLTNALNNLEKSTNNQTLKYELIVNRMKNIAERSSKDYNKNGKIEVLQALEEIIKANPSEYITTEAQLEKERILEKYLQIRHNEISYEGENARVFVEFKNVDSLKISYYKISAKEYSEKIANSTLRNTKNDNILSLLKSKILAKEAIIKLPNPKDHHLYSTEVLLEKLPLGNYVIVFEDMDKKSNTELEKNYSFYTVSNISYVQDDSADNDLFYALHRKTGEPLSKAYISTQEKTTKANNIGKIEYPKVNDTAKTKIQETYLIHQKDTLVINSLPNQKYKYDRDDEEEFEAKAMLYFDRAIYRPGQKVYFKGIVIQNKNNIKSVVPKLTVHLTIEDASYEKLKEMDIQTNEFGSFSGEFEIPKNCMTGEFNIEVDEPDDNLFNKDKKYYNKRLDEHSFWENVDFNSNEFRFKVEEYKRPTFEITFDKIKETYSIGDNLQVKGYAKTLAGSNLTNTSVKYTISKHYYSKTEGYSKNENYIIKETTTNENGEFIIPFETALNNLNKEDIREITFTLNINVTDINGESRSIEHEIEVENKTLKINAKTNPFLFYEDTNKINIEVTNFDNSPIPHSGKIEIYKISGADKLKNKKYGIPDIQGFSEKEFKKLFPYESYKESENSKTLIETLYFDTKNGNEINLPKLEKGKYNIVTTIVDTKTNTITETKNITINSKANPLNDNRVFAFKRINKEDEENIHFELFSNLETLYITTRLYYGQDLLEEKVTMLENKKGIVSFKKNKNPKYNYSFHFSTQWENDGYAENVTIAKEAVSRKINFEVASFRTKIEPGSQEKWSFKIKDNNLETEVLASMYDSSLDQFTKKNWEKPEFYHYYDSPNYPNINNYNMTYVNFDTRTKKIYYKKVTFEPTFQWFGFSFSEPKNNYRLKQYERIVAQPQVIRAGTKQITGTVSDANGPLPGVNVVVKDTTTGVSTGFDGAYTIYATEGEQLVFSFLGMNEVVKTVGSSNVMNIVLQEDTKKLETVVVTALNIKKESNSMNPNIIIVTSNDKDLSYFNKYKKQIFDEEGVLKEKKSATTAASYQITSGEINIRGMQSSTSEEKALIVIDGEIQNVESLKNISSDNVSSITILKGTEGTALYGSQGKNGVIIIITKNALKELSKVKTRSNFNETAFFYPHLTTDSKGKIAFNFTTPESLTRWKLRLLGHDKNADFGTFETEIISQKDLMIIPNMPRFLRETDTVTIAAKVTNLTNEVKSGNAMLLLFDATTGNPIDAICSNNNNLKPFNCKAKENTSVSWSITIPEGIQGIQYKIVAKSGGFSDGEENILPVLSNRILVTESLPIWVREKSKKEFTFENLKNNTSKTLKNQSFTFEYTSNPTWLAIQSLPYLMEFEHECAEQTFARFYANTLAYNIVNSQPKVAEVFEKWRKEPQQKSKLEMNEELKSIVLRETPWLLDANENEKNQRLAYLFDLQKLAESSKNTLVKLKEKQNPSGAFPWFGGGNDSYYITQHIVSGLGHLQNLFPTTDLYTITDKAIPYLDTNFISNTEKQRKEKQTISDQEFQYLYGRSFYTKTYPISKELKSVINYQIQQTKTNWLQYSLGRKAMLAMAANRLGDSIYAKKIITHLKETAVKNSEEGMYWMENKNGWSWFDAPIENQALLIEAFTELDNNPQIINDLKVWLIRNKQKENWGTTKATTEAIYALLFNGKNWLEAKNDNSFQIGNQQILNQKLEKNKTESEAGYMKLQWKPEEINKEMAAISIENKSDVPSFGGVYWQYFENLENIKNSNNPDLKITKEVYKKVKDDNGDKLISLQNNELKVGDKLTIRLIIKANHLFEFVHLKDLRASCLEPTNVISEHLYKDSLSYYMSTKDTATHFFFDDIKQGTYVLEYDVIVNNSGNFNNGIATIQSMYAPEFNSNSTSQKIKVK